MPVSLPAMPACSANSHLGITTKVSSHCERSGRLASTSSARWVIAASRSSARSSTLPSIRREHQVSYVGTRVRPESPGPYRAGASD